MSKLNIIKIFKKHTTLNYSDLDIGDVFMTNFDNVDDEAVYMKIRTWKNNHLNIMNSVELNTGDGIFVPDSTPVKVVDASLHVKIKD